MVQSYCTEPGTGAGAGAGINGSNWLLCRTVSITPGQGTELDTIGFHIQFSVPIPAPVPSSVQCN